jgi:hypothetical protein
VSTAGLQLRAILPLLLFACELLAAHSAMGQGAQAEPDASISSAREALSDGSNPWYDSEKDSLKRLELEEDRGSTDWRFSGFGTVFKIVVYALLGLALAALVALLIWFALNQKRSSKTAKSTSDGVSDADQVEALPFMAERPRGDLLGQARRHYEQGNYSEAIIYLFSYELVELDKFAQIQLAKGKTNRQYLREVSTVAPLRSPLERTLLAFESVFFGRRTLDRAGFEACWNELPHFEAQLRAAT